MNYNLILSQILWKCSDFIFFPPEFLKSVCLCVYSMSFVECVTNWKRSSWNLVLNTSYGILYSFIYLFLQEELSESLNLQKQLTEELQVVKQVCWNFFKIKSLSLEICLYPEFQPEQLPSFLLPPNTSVSSPPKLLPFLLSCTAAGFFAGSQLHQMQKLQNIIWKIFQFTAMQRLVLRFCSLCVSVKHHCCHQMQENCLKLPPLILWCYLLHSRPWWNKPDSFLDEFKQKYVTEVLHMFLFINGYSVRHSGLELVSISSN